VSPHNRNPFFIPVAEDGQNHLLAIVYSLYPEKWQHLKKAFPWQNWTGSTKAWNYNSKTDIKIQSAVTADSVSIKYTHTNSGDCTDRGWACQFVCLFVCLFHLFIYLFIYLLHGRNKTAPWFCSLKWVYCTRENPTSLLCPSRIPYGLSWYQTPSSMVKSLSYGRVIRPQWHLVAIYITFIKIV
jgi:hypothetical protein